MWWRVVHLACLPLYHILHIKEKNPLVKRGLGRVDATPVSEH